MIKKPIALLLAALLSTGTCLAEDAKEVTPPAGDANIATVNGTPYSLDLFRMFYMDRMQETQHENDQAFQQQAFNEFMSLVVASQEADRRKLQDDPGVATALELQRLKVMSNAALASMAREIQVSDDELTKAYEQVKKQAARTEYKARHILVKDEDEAKKLIKELDKKADFAELAKKHSLGPTGKSGGEARVVRQGPDGATFRRGGRRHEARHLHQGADTDSVRLAHHRAPGDPHRRAA